MGEGIITWNDTTSRDHSYPTHFATSAIRTPFQQQTMSIHHCAWITGDDRMPRTIGRGPATQTGLTRFDMRNCLSYNWKGNNFGNLSRGFYTEGNYNAWIAANGFDAFVSENNIVKCQSIKSSRGSADNAFTWHYHQVGMFFSQNLGPLSPVTPVDGFAIGTNRINHLWDGHSASPATNSHGTYSTTTYDNGVAFTAPAIVETDVSSLLAEATTEFGATLPAKDSTWQRIMDYTIADTGPDTQDFDLTEGYPTLAGGTYPTHSQPDGIPDTWKTSKGLDIGTDYTGVSGVSGYNHVENYANETAGDTIPDDYASAPTVSVASSILIVKNIATPITITATDSDSDIVLAQVTSDNGTGAVTLQGSATVS